MEELYYESERFENLKFTGEDFKDCRFADCEFVRCTFEDCSLTGCSLTGCSFDHCMIAGLRASEYSQLQYAEFRGCSLVGIHWHELLPSARFVDPVRSLQDCRMKYNTFSHMNLKKFRFTGNELTDSMFADCDLNESSFRTCRLDRTEFFKCDLRMADFRDALGYKIDITNCKVKGAVFSFPEVVNLLKVLEIKID